MSGLMQRFRSGMGRVLGLGYDAAESSRLRRDMGWGRSTPRDEDSLVAADRTREWIRLKGSDLRRNNATVAGLCERIDTFFVGCGLTAEAATSDKGWNDAADQFCAEYFRSCDVRGDLSFYDLQGIAASCRPTQGGLYLELLENGQTRPIECERIRNPTDPEKAKGYVDGVQYERGTGRVKGYWVHSRDAGGAFTGPHDEGFIPAENMVPVTRPPWRADQRREIPDLAPIIPILTDVHEMDTYIRNTAKTRSQIIAFIKRVNGLPPNMQGRNATDQVAGQREVWRMDWGQAHTMFPNEEMQFPSVNMPDPNSIPYIKLDLLLACSALNFPYEFGVMDFSTLDFSRQKGVLLVVNRVRRKWLDWLTNRMCQRIRNWRIAKEMGPGGFLAGCPVDKVTGVSEWWKCDWQADEELDLDRQGANQSDMLEWQMGLQPLSVAASRRGRKLEASLRQKAAILKLAAQIESENGLPPDTLIKTQIPGQTNAPAAKNDEPGKGKEAA